MINNSSNENDETISNEEISQKKEEGLKILFEMEDLNNLIRYDDLLSSAHNYNNNNESYYLINKNWYEKFKKFCNSNNDFAPFNYPGIIKNKDLIIEDDKSLKIKNEIRIYFNNAINFDDNCLFVKENIWIQLKNIFGGDKEYKVFLSKKRFEFNKKRSSYKFIIYT